MSKSILSIGLSVVAIGVAVFAPELIPALIPGISALGTAAVVAGVEIGLALTSSLLLGPSVPKGLTQTATSRLFATLVTTEPRKIVFGITAAATDVRYL